MKCVRFNGLACPHDGLPLAVKDSAYVCSAGHSFDVAKSGYINLLPNTLKGSREPGDNTEMVKARTAFLNTGAYAQLRERISDLVVAALAPQRGNTCANIVDAGCGEGYYTAGFAEALRAVDGGEFAVMGFDISKPAIMAASKRTKEITWAVGNNKKMPVQTGCVQVLTSLFGFPVHSEFKRVLAADGCLILVDTGPQHLVEIRRDLYDDIKVKTPSVDADFEDQFSVVEEVALTYMVELATPEDVRNLIAMTPHAYRASGDKVEAAVQCGPRSVTLDFVMKVCAPRV